jgi:hypothetical protein
MNTTRKPLTISQFEANCQFCLAALSHGKYSLGALNNKIIFEQLFPT